MKTALGTKLGILRTLVFMLYLATATLLAIFVWASNNTRNQNSELIFLFYAAMLGFVGLIGDIICDLGMSQIRSEQRQELILQELRQKRS